VETRVFSPLGKKSIRLNIDMTKSLFYLQGAKAALFPWFWKRKSV